jgi:peptidoglycan/xylan/chitin deacetylase (PgdA/CDA1 family)
MRLRRTLHWIMRRARPSLPKPVILMYHRIADEFVDPWGLAVSPTRFAEQLQVLCRIRHPMPLTNFVRAFISGTLPARAVAVTFDDGYADNLLAGKPRLEAADVPATVFLATGYLDHSAEFWWDELARLVLVESGPQNIDVVIGGRIMHFELSTDVPMRGNDPWRVGSPPLTGRHKAYLAIWRALRPLGDEERHGVMAQLRCIFSDESSFPARGRAMTREQARTLANGGLVTIGAHTVTHPQLTSLADGARRREIFDSKAACEALTVGQVSGFAYPYGDLDGEVRSVVDASGFTYACSTRYGPISSTSDVFELPRIHVHNWDGDAFERALRASSARNQT